MQRRIWPRVIGTAVAFSIVGFGLTALSSLAQTKAPKGEPASPDQGAIAEGQSLAPGASTGAAAEGPATASTKDDPPPPGEVAAASLRRGDTLLKLGRAAQAATAFAEAIAATPQSHAAHERLRRALAQLQRHEEVADVTAKLSRLYLQISEREGIAAPDAADARTLANVRLDELIALAPAHAERPSLEEALGRMDGPRSQKTDWFARFRSVIGILVLLAAAWALSNNRWRVSIRVVLWGLGLQLCFALFILRLPVGRTIFDGARIFVNRILSFTDDGAGFIFGGIYKGVIPGLASGPVMYTDGTSGDLRELGVIFAFHVLPTIIFFGALMSVLYHLGLVQLVVRGIAWVMQRTMGTSGAESLSAAGNIFVGQTEAPLLIKPYVGDMTISELMAVMCGGFATVAGGVLAAYVRFGIDAGHLLAASVMSAPAALVVAKILYPETDISKTAPGTKQEVEKTTANVIDAAAGGAADGLKLAFNVAAMLLAFIALVALVNGLVGWVGTLLGVDLSLRTLFGLFFYPLSWCMGVDTKDLLDFGNLLGTKIAVNEFVAYVELGNLQSRISPRTFTIATYALCGFANFSSIGIQIGGISGIAPARRSDLARIGLKAMLGGAIASWLTACVAGILL